MQPWIDRINRPARVLEIGADVPLGRVVGKRIGEATCRHPCTGLSQRHYARSFVGGESRAGDLTEQMLTRLGGLDIPDYRFTARPFPFIDLYPWRDTVSTRVDAIGQLQLYMTTVLPIITVSFSSWVSSVGSADFLHHHGLSFQEGNRYLQYVGIPQLVAILDKGWDQRWHG